MSYTTIKLPSDFVIEILDPLVEKKSLGFSSRTDAIKTALREYYEKKNPIKPEVFTQ
jgi:metal-responsive CopG/Arc/MetJ family transcriptional regulator